jgi:two-component system, NtrC family, sensor kinase
VRRRKDLQFNWVFVCFAIFIVACGTTHLMEIVTIWRPVYWLSGIVKAITALASLPTAVLLVRLVPEAPAPEFGESLRIVVKPDSQLWARRNVLHP